MTQTQWIPSIRRTLKTASGLELLLNVTIDKFDGFPTHYIKVTIGVSPWAYLSSDRALLHGLTMIRGAVIRDLSEMADLVDRALEEEIVKMEQGEPK